MRLLLTTSFPRALLTAFTVWLALAAGNLKADTLKSEVEDLYNPFEMLDLYLKMDPDDFLTIQSDTTYDIEVPAWFGTAFEEPVLISVRRKSASALPNEMDPQKKVSYKLDINEFKDQPGGTDLWHGVKKLSLENGDDMDVVAEGFAWYLHRLAAQSGLNYQTGRASWVNLYINDSYMGVYVNVEQPDKQFLKNRSLWDGGDETWLYKMSDIDSPEAKEAPEDGDGEPVLSPASASLCYKPFVGRGKCETPIDFKARLEELVNMEGLLTFGAVTALHYSPDDLFSKGKNFYYIDFATGAKREYAQWDLDSAFGSMDPNRSMYDQGRGKFDRYEEALVQEPDAPFRDEYTAIIDQLINGGVFDEIALLADLQAFELMLRDDLARDPNSKEAAGRFSSLSQYLPMRLASMRSQLPAQPPGDGDEEPQPPSDGTEGEFHIGDLEGGAISLGQKNWTAFVTITVHDYLHGPNGVAGAEVTGSWSGGVDGELSCVTKADGTCMLKAEVTARRLKKVTFTLADVTLFGTDAEYLSASNHDVDGDSDGNSISIRRP
jgi:hypothetical protein